MQDNRKYAALAVGGRWIHLVRVWLEDNAPCDRDKMTRELVPIMPFHIRRESKCLASKERLVRDAFFMLYGTTDIPEVIPRPPARKNNRTQKGFCDELREAARSRGRIERHEFPHINNFHKLATGLVKQGEFVKVRTGVYELPQS